MWDIDSMILQYIYLKYSYAMLDPVAHDHRVLYHWAIYFNLL